MGRPFQQTLQLQTPMFLAAAGSPVLVPSTAVHPAAHSRIPVPQQQAAATGPGLVLTTCTRARTAARTTAARKNQTAASKSKSEEELVAHGITLTTSGNGSDS